MNRIYMNKLFDLYKDLLTEHEQLIFIDYYEQDLSLSEIATNENVSRSAVSKTLKVIEDKLNNYEDKIGLSRRNDLLNKALISNNLEDIKKIISKVL